MKIGFAPVYDEKPSRPFEVVRPMIPSLNQIASWVREVKLLKKAQALIHHKNVAGLAALRRASAPGGANRFRKRRPPVTMDLASFALYSYSKCRM